MKIADLLEKQALNQPDSLFIQTSTRKYSYLDVYHLVLRYSSYIHRHYQGKTFGLLMEDPFECIVSFLALIRCGKRVFLFNHKNVNLSRHYAEIYHCDVLLDSLPKDLDSHDGPSESSLCNESEICIFTSGTTADPKCVLHRYSQAIAHAKVSTKTLDFTSLSSWLLLLPLFHVSGLGILFRVLFSGGTIVLDDISTSMNFTHVSLVASQLSRFMSYHPTSSLDCLLLGGAKLQHKDIQEALSAGLPIYMGYGMTETFSHVSLTSLQSSSIDCSGQCLSHSLIKVIDGEIRVKSDSLFSGYLSPKGDLISPLDDDGFFNTHDLGTLKGSQLFVSGRADHMFISNGENISVESLEQLVLEDKHIQEFVIVPVEDSLRGHVGCAFSVTSYSEEELSFAVRKKILRFYSSLYLPKYLFIIHQHEYDFANSRDYFQQISSDYIEKKPQ